MCKIGPSGGLFSPLAILLILCPSPPSGKNPHRQTHAAGQQRHPHPLLPGAHCAGGRKLSPYPSSLKTHLPIFCGTVPLYLGSCPRGHLVPDSLVISSISYQGLTPTAPSWAMCLSTTRWAPPFSCGFPSQAAAGVVISSPASTCHYQARDRQIRRCHRVALGETLTIYRPCPHRQRLG